MKRLFELAVVCALTAVILLCLQVAWSVRALTPKVEYTLENANRAIRETAQTVANVRHATAEWEKASQEQAAYWTESSQKATASLADLDAFIRHTDYELNEKVLPGLNDAVFANSAQLVELEKQTAAATERIAADTDAMLRETTAVMQAAAKTVGDPAIAASLANVEKTTANVAETTASIERSTQVLEAKVKQLTKPASLAKRMSLGILDYAYKFRGLLGL